MNLRRNLKKRNQLFVTLLCFLLLTGYSGTVVASDILELDPVMYASGIVLLTPGSSTTLDFQPGRPSILVPVVTVGQGTLQVNFEKSDTRRELVSMYVLGYPAEPAFIPSFGITPANITVSTEINDALGGSAIFLILITVNSSRSYASELTITLN